jgi:LuxR family transcriptional regulator, maltose regulon positive regulatory protein
VPRPALVDLLDAQSVPPICVVAPPGYGKTTLLTQSSEYKSHPVGWISVDERDNDPVGLLTYIAVALDRIEPIDLEVFGILAAPRISVVASVVPWMAAVVSAITQPARPRGGAGKRALR